MLGQIYIRGDRWVGRWVSFTVSGKKKRSSKVLGKVSEIDEREARRRLSLKVVQDCLVKWTAKLDGKNGHGINGL